jgi:hypothetical protein
MDNYLFSRGDWFSTDDYVRKAMRQEIGAIDADRLLNTSVDDLAKYFEAKYKVDVPVLRAEELVVDQREVQLDVSRDTDRLVFDRSRPFFVTGTQISVEVPFDGDAGAFNIQATTSTTMRPRASINNGVLTFSISGTNLTPDQVKRQIDQQISSIQQHLDWLRNDASRLNGQLFNEARTQIEARRQKLLADRRLVASLGFKMKERSSAARTYVAPEVRRKISPVMPAASTAPYKPEPALSVGDYEHILGVMENMARVMELSPSAFESMDEEALRSHFLVQLNGHYEGQATGETFNYEGKTDILIRSEGRNIFIAECKFWSGPKKLAETIDQLLGYTSWRDTKTAVVIFNRNKDFSKVLTAIQETVRTHPQYKRDLPGSAETTFRYCFANRDDKNRELFLTVLAFDVPS